MDINFSERSGDSPGYRFFYFFETLFIKCNIFFFFLQLSLALFQQSDQLPNFRVSQT